MFVSNGREKRKKQKPCMCTCAFVTVPSFAFKARLVQDGNWRRPAVGPAKDCRDGSKLTGRERCVNGSKLTVPVASGV